jgi:hypothetical protein
MELVKAIEGDEKPVIRVDTTPRHVGRGPENDLVLDDPTVSSRHATVWAEAGRGWIRDGNSRNGTYVNDERVRMSPIQDGDKVKIGGVELVVRGGADLMPAWRIRTWFVEDADTGARFPFRGSQFVLGAGPAADLRLPLSTDDDAVFVVDDGTVTLTRLESEEAIGTGVVVEIGGRRLRVVEADLDLAETRDLGPRTFAYTMHVAMKGFVGPVATLTDPSTGRTHQVDAEHRAVLLYLLARARVAAKTAGDDAAWCTDEDVSKGIWGRRGAIDANSLHVLVHRLRKELKQAGFEPWFLEKRRRGIRLALTDVTID